MEEKLINRNIPAATRRILRQEVNYGCPVNSCGSPYLSYHHFDPPWHEGKHHNPDGMIALCLHHHKAADNGAYTNSQLRKMKLKPFVNKNESIIGEITWNRDNLLFDIGGNYFMGASQVYITKKEPLISLKFNNENKVLISFNLKDESGELIFAMDDNDWIISSNLEDIETPPAMKAVRFKDKTKSIRFSIEFRQFGKTDFLKTYKETMAEQIYKDILGKVPDDKIVVCKVRGLLPYPFKIKMMDGYTNMKNAVGPFSMHGGLIKIAEGGTVANVDIGNNYVVGDGVLLS